MCIQQRKTEGTVYTLYIAILMCVAFYQVLAKSYQLGVGGRYFDEHLVNHFAEEFKVWDHVMCSL